MVIALMSIQLTKSWIRPNDCRDHRTVDRIAKSAKLKKKEAVKTEYHRIDYLFKTFTLV